MDSFEEITCLKERHILYAKFKKNYSHLMITYHVINVADKSGD